MGSFNKWLMEINKWQLDNADFDPDEVNLPFDDIFGDEYKTRVVIPWELKDILEFLDAMRIQGYQVDITNNIAYKTVKTEKGNKTRQFRIGKILQRLSKDPEDGEYWEDWLNWWQVEKPKIEKNKSNPEDLSIVISRHPIDIIRMSDHPGITSCHAPHRNFFKCAINEAKTGGAIAYIVKNSDLADIDLDEEDELFADYDRGIGGIRPLERLRLRRLTKNNNDGPGPKELLIPEDSTYGKGHSGFVNNIKRWLWAVQDIDPSNPPEFHDYDLRGGSYQDTSIDELWSDFFGKYVKGEKESIDQDNEEEQFVREAEQTLEEHQQLWKHVGGSINDDDGGGYIWVSIGLTFEFPPTEFNQIFDKEANKYMAHLPTEREWMGDSWQDSDSLYKQFEDATSEYIWSREEFAAYEHNNQVNISIGVQDHEEGSVYSNLDSFESFLDQVDEIDKNYDEHKQKLYKVLIENGYIKDWRIESHETLSNFKNFDFEEDEDDPPILKSKPLWLGNMQGLNSESIGFNISSPYIEPLGLDNTLKLEFLNRSITHSIQSVFPKELIANQDLRWFVYSNINAGNAFKNIAFDKDAKKVIDKPLFAGVFITIDLEVTMDKEKFLNLVHILDNHWQELQSRLHTYWEHIYPILKTQTFPNFINMTPPGSKLPSFKPREQLPNRQGNLEFGTQLGDSPQIEYFIVRKGLDNRKILS